MSDSLLSVTNLGVAYGARRSSPLVVRGVSFDLAAGESIGIVGESGSGKTTTARAIVGLQSFREGTVRLAGENLSARRTRAQRRAIQMVFQDPGSSLNPSLTLRTVLAELLPPRYDSRVRREARVSELISLVGLPAGITREHPQKMSGGQKQRAAIARALAVEPQVIVADEATSALDVSVQATVLNLLMDLRDEMNLAIVFISHDLTVVRRVCDRIAVMKGGEIVEAGSVATVFESPAHPYTRELLAAIPHLPTVH